MTYSEDDDDEEHHEAFASNEVFDDFFFGDDDTRPPFDAARGLSHFTAMPSTFGMSARSAAPTEEADGCFSVAPDQAAQVSPSDDAHVGDLPGWQEEGTTCNASGSLGVPAAVSAYAAEVLARLGRLMQDLQDDRHPLFGQTPAVQAVESDDEDDPQRVSEYIMDICDRLEELETVDACPNFIEAQPEIDANVRGVALDWLVEVQGKFKLRKETLFLAVSIFDRFLTTKTVKRKDLQLIMVSAVFIAAKFEEIDPPDVRDFVFITKQACDKDAILAMEVNMLTALEFCLCRPTAAHYLERYQRANSSSNELKYFLQYLLELALMDVGMVRYPPSLQTAAALIVSSGLLQRQPVWPIALVDRLQGTDHVVRACAVQFCKLVEAADTNPLQAVRRKFLKRDYARVAALDFNSVGA